MANVDYSDHNLLTPDPAPLPRTSKGILESREMLQTQIQVLCEALEQAEINANDYEVMFDQSMKELIQVSDEHEALRQGTLELVSHIRSLTKSSLTDSEKLSTIHTLCDSAIRGE